MGLSHDVQDDEIISLFQHGKSIADIARQLNTTYETVK
jgi:DNA-binding NarL/FixJ family response regulator